VEIVVDGDGAHATVAVRDTGEGISPEDRPFVFDRFYRGDPSREGRGAGLGLAIARGLAAAHRGAIELESTLGEGSTFTLSLPMSRPAAPRPGDPAAAPPVVH
jgi:signal transduction histidine kinase